MVGFPGEKEEDFELTLEFIGAHAPYIDQVSPSDAFTAIIPGTELHERAADFGITSVTNSWLWEVEGNTFDVRLSRFERLCVELSRLGIKNAYPMEQLANRYERLGDFHAFDG